MARQTMVSRRDLLAAGTGVGLTAVGGCLGQVTPAAKPARTRVSLLAAGSLNHALENRLRDTLAAKGITLRIEARGSAEIVRLVAAGQKDPDVITVADPALFENPLSPAWYLGFASNTIVLAYRPDSRGGKLIADAGPEGWYEPLVDRAVSLGRTDPDLDPLGYRTLFVLELASDYYNHALNLRDVVPKPEQIYPETQLISRFETGAIDVAFTYRNMAVDRDYEYVELPAPINLGHPQYRERYQQPTYTLPDGTTVTGDLITYAATIPSGHRTPAVEQAFISLTAGSYLPEAGFTIPSDYPRPYGDVPDTLTPKHH